MASPLSSPDPSASDELAGGEGSAFGRLGAFVAVLGTFAPLSPFALALTLFPARGVPDAAFAPARRLPLLAAASARASAARLMAMTTTDAFRPGVFLGRSGTPAFPARARSACAPPGWPPAATTMRYVSSHSPSVVHTDFRSATASLRAGADIFRNE